MTNVTRDANGVWGMLGTSNADGITVLPVQVDPTLHGIIIDDNTTGSNLSANNVGKRDQNQVPVLMGVSNVDGVTPVQCYIDSATGKLLINSN
jgi:hypothetical protein